MDEGNHLNDFRKLSFDSLPSDIYLLHILTFYMYMHICMCIYICVCVCVYARYTQRALLQSTLYL